MFSPVAMRRNSAFPQTRHYILNNIRYQNEYVPLCLCLQTKHDALMASLRSVISMTTNSAADHNDILSQITLFSRRTVILISSGESERRAVRLPRLGKAFPARIIRDLKGFWRLTFGIRSSSRRSFNPPRVEAKLIL